jgi:Ca-activated chloride channel family protein
VSFATPVALFGLLLLPLLAATYIRAERRGRGRREAIVSAQLLPAVAPRRPRWRRHVPVALMAVAVGALVVALARPQTTQAVAVEEATVVVATDRSGSMLATDVAPDRLTAARRAAQTFVDAVPTTMRVGALAFNHQPTVLASPTRDHDAVRAALGTVEAAGSTATGDALAAALALIPQDTPAPNPLAPGGATEAERPPAAIVLLSDGASVRGRDVMDVAEEARRAEVPVYTVALGTQSGTITGADGVTRDVPPDVATLRAIAERTGGEAFSADDAEELTSVYERLGSRLATEDEEVEVTSAFAGGALLLLLIGALSSIRWFGRPV